MTIGYSDSGVLIQVVGADYRNTPGLLIPQSGGHPQKPATYSELAALESQANEKIQILQDQIAFLASQVQILLDRESGSDRVDYLVTTPTIDREFVHNFGVNPSTVSIYSLINGELITDTCQVIVTDPGRAIAVRTDIPIAYRLILKP